MCKAPKVGFAYKVGGEHIMLEAVLLHSPISCGCFEFIGKAPKVGFA
jgi:hypothetical protein